ncbi:hypothetical protein G7Y89_g2567 [Cudoniella acicularis]|uniref:Major facilitator superfamily (MFS) profile domain-containing protein n=1 Tax=Cudoniella acicularis TaxID=354080 RepID=A0A8H4RUU7_9HELO|nr:hypothetical protein G7Y89_g2567 [Cudoniella acicularis]
MLTVADFAASSVAMASTEKETVLTDLEKTALSEIDSPSRSPIQLSPLQYRKIIWKLDLHLLPPLFALWFVSLMDRINIGSAAIFGIQKDLGMSPKSNDFNIALIIVLVGLVTMEVPSNWLLKKTSPSKVLAIESLLLAIFTIGEGVITTFTGFKVLRFFVGVFEAGLIPGSVFLLAQYYPEYELQRRLSMLMVGNAVSTAFGGLLALAIAGIHSSNGYHPWRWIFIIEGCITVGITVIVYPFMSDWPATAKWLTTQEKAVLSENIRGRGLIGRMDRLDAKALQRIFLDWKMYVVGATACCTTVTLYSVAIFAPTIISQFSANQSPRHVQALTIPIFVAASVGCLAAAYASDKTKHRSAFVLFGYSLTIVGAGILMNQEHFNVHVKYGALYFMEVGSFISLPMLWTMLVNNMTTPNSATLIEGSRPTTQNDLMKSEPYLLTPATFSQHNWRQIRKINRDLADPRKKHLEDWIEGLSSPLRCRSDFILPKFNQTTGTAHLNLCREKTA